MNKKLIKEVPDLSNKLERAKNKYRMNSKEYRKMRGRKRSEFKPIYDASREKYYNLQIEENVLKQKLLNEKLCDDIDIKLKNRIINELEILGNKYKKYVSRIKHEDWLEYTRSVWPFKEMESNVNVKLHPAQFSSEIPKRCITLYSFYGDLILDPFMGVGTTLYQAINQKRRSVGIDIDDTYVDYVKNQISNTLIEEELYVPLVKQGDARSLNFIEDESIDLIVTHPPYFNVVKTSDSKGDLSHFKDSEYQLFLGEMGKVYDEFKRVLKEDRVAVIVTGDVIKKIDGITQQLCLHSDYINMMLNRNFILWNIYIYETKIRKSAGKPTMGSYPYPHKLFSQIAHNYVLVFRKLKEN